MAVYVDNMCDTGVGNFGRMKMSHMIADTKANIKVLICGTWILYPFPSARRQLDSGPSRLIFVSTRSE